MTIYGHFSVANVQSVTFYFVIFIHKLCIIGLSKIEIETFEWVHYHRVDVMWTLCVCWDSVKYNSDCKSIC